MSDFSNVSTERLLQMYKAAKDPLENALAAEGVKGPIADLARSIYAQESSSGRNIKTSNAGAVGGMQILPGTFSGVADKDWDINDPIHNARAGVRYLKQMYTQAGGDPAIAAAGYYGGPGGLEKARRGVAVSDPRNPNAPTTLQYGQQVAARLPSMQGSKSNATTSAPSEEESPFAKMSTEELLRQYKRQRRQRPRPHQPPPRVAQKVRGSLRLKAAQRSVSTPTLAAKPRTTRLTPRMQSSWGWHGASKTQSIQEPNCSQPAMTS